MLNLHPKFNFETFDYNFMNKKIIIVLLFSALAFLMSVNLVVNQEKGPFFINTNQVASAYAPLLSVNENLAKEEQSFNKKLSVYDDSISKIMGSLKNHNDSLESLLQLVNMEMNVYQHKMIDSMLNVSEIQLTLASEKFNQSIAAFCQKIGADVMFDIGQNVVVYGSDTKADKTKELIDFFAGK